MSRRDLRSPFEHEPEIVALHEAIGRYFTVFSGVVASMRHGIDQFMLPIDVDRGVDPSGLLDILLASMTAQPLASAFFAMATKVGEFDDDDERIKNWIRKQTQDQVTFRNDVAHADWLVGWRDFDTGVSLPPAAFRIKSLSGVPTRQNVGIQIEDLYLRINRARFLERQILHLAFVARSRQCGGAARLSDEVRFVEDGGESWIEDREPESGPN